LISGPAVMATGIAPTKVMAVLSDVVVVVRLK
jgi:hypothetical protein